MTPAFFLSISRTEDSSLSTGLAVFAVLLRLIIGATNVWKPSLTLKSFNETD
jgi:hypothetical protein